MDSKSTLLSVIIPVYNVGIFLEKCIVSIVGQKFDGLYEIILVENGSTDNSYQIAEKLCISYPDKVRLIKIDEADVSKARNVGINQAKGKYITFVDGDDWIEPDMFKSLLEIAQVNDADIVESNYFLNSPKKKSQIIGDELCLNEGKIKIKTGLQAMIDILLEKSISSPCGRIYRRDFLGSEYRFPEGVFYEDHACIYRWSAKASKVVHIDKAYYHYDLRPGSTTGITKRSEKKASDFFNAEFDRIAFVLGSNLSDDSKKEVIRHIAHRCIHIFGKVCIVAYGIKNLQTPEMMALRFKLLQILDLPWGMLRFEDRTRLWRIKYGLRGYARKKLLKEKICK